MITRFRSAFFWSGIMLVCLGGFSLLGQAPDELWIRRNPTPTGNYLSGVSFGNQTYVAVGYRGTVVSSRDSKVWIQEPGPTSELLNDIAFGNGRFVATSAAGIFISADGRQWQIAFQD